VGGGLLVAAIVLAFLNLKSTPSRGDNTGFLDGESIRIIPNDPMRNFAASIRNSIIRMVLRGTPPEKLRFNYPDAFDALDDVTQGVFHPEGGNVTIYNYPGELMVDGRSKRWFFNGEFEVKGIGPNTKKGRSEIIAFNVGVIERVCIAANMGANISTIPRLKSDQSHLYTKQMIDDGLNDYVLPKGKQPELNHPDLSGKVFGCFQSHNGKDYVTFTTLLER
jgi:hypothetical protein